MFERAFTLYEGVIDSKLNNLERKAEMLEQQKAKLLKQTLLAEANKEKYQRLH